MAYPVGHTAASFGRNTKSIHQIVAQGTPLAYIENPGWVTLAINHSSTPSLHYKGAKRTIQTGPIILKDKASRSILDANPRLEYVVHCAFRAARSLTVNQTVRNNSIDRGARPI